MEDDGRGLRDRLPKRQLVYPFIELEFQNVYLGSERQQDEIENEI